VNLDGCCSKLLLDFGSHRFVPRQKVSLDRISALGQGTVNTRVIWLTRREVGAQGPESLIFAHTKADVRLDDPLKEKILEDLGIKYDFRSFLPEGCFDGLLMRTRTANDCTVYTDLMLDSEVFDRIFRGTDSEGGCS
jgi:hypothetical protein